MEEYMHTIFYNPEQVMELLDEFKKEVKELSYNILLEEKHVKSNHREPTDKSLEWILDMCDRTYNVTICHRMPNFNNKECFQVVFRATPDIGWYLAWCDIEIEYKDYFIEKYKLVIL